MLETADQVASVIAAALAVGGIVTTWLGILHARKPRKIGRAVGITSALTVLAVVVILIFGWMFDEGERRPDPDARESTSVAPTEPSRPPTASSGRSSPPFTGSPGNTDRPEPSVQPESTRPAGGEPPTTSTVPSSPDGTPYGAEPILLGMGVSVSPRSGAVSCGPGEIFVFTFEVSAKQAGKVEYVLRPEEALKQPEQSGTMTFSAANTERVEYTVLRTGDPGQQLRGSLTAEVVSPEGDRGIVGDAFDVTCQ